MARFASTLLKREATSKETKVSLSSKVCEDMNLVKSGELRTLWAINLLERNSGPGLYWHKYSTVVLIR